MRKTELERSERESLVGLVAIGRQPRSKGKRNKLKETSNFRQLESGNGHA